ncbi:hypothetical protein [Cryobacterium sp. MP_3.1]|uniref:hypothetical protein n=1 Tax=Cryobacterium sp. MP_3.1 TaxID=3071711 RepID=UPI002E0F69B2
MRDVEAAVEEVAKAFKLFVDRMENRDVVEQLAAAVAHLLGLSQAVSSLPARRPSIPIHGATVAALERGVQFWSDYREALTAATIHEAQRLGGRGQAHLDSVADAYSGHLRAHGAAEGFDGDSGISLFQRVFRGIEHNYPGVSILEIDERGRAEVAKFAGVDVASGMGAEFLVLDTVAAAHLDGHRLRRVLAESARFCSNAPLLVSVAESEGVLDGLAASRRRLAEALNAFESVMLSETNGETIFRRLMRLHAEVYEEVAGPLFALYLLLAGAKSRPYLKLILDGATLSSDALKRVPQLDEWFLGRDNFLRNAAQHGGGFRVDGDNVVFTLKTYQGTHSALEVVDMILANLESLSAASWALRNALEVAGIAIPLSDSDADYLGLSGIELSRVMLEHHGLEVEVLSRNEHWGFQVSGSEVKPFNLALVIAMSEAASQIQTVTIGLDGSKGDTMELSLDSYREFAANAGKLQGASAIQGIVELRHACKVGGHGMLTSNDLMFAVAHAGAFLLAGNTNLIGLLRRAQKLANEYNFLDVQTLVSEVFTEFRGNEPRAIAGLQRRLTELGAATAAPAVPECDRVRVVLVGGS